MLTDGVSPFLDVLQHWQGLALSNNTIYHDTSFDSFLRSTARFMGVELVWTRILAYAAKAALAGREPDDDAAERAQPAVHQDA